MNRLQLARIVEWGGEVKTRKRLQKVVYLLKAAGCPLDVEFALHLYGPYSSELAALTDQMVGANLLVENSSPNVIQGQSYSYVLSESARSQLLAQGECDRRMAPFKDLARRLLREESLSKLEYASTVAFFRKQGKSWSDASVAAAKFKNLKPDSIAIKDAERIAREILGA